MLMRKCFKYLLKGMLIILILFVTNIHAGSLSKNSAPVNQLNKSGKVKDWLVIGPFPNYEIDESSAEDGAFRSGFHTDYLKDLGGEEYAVINKNTEVKYTDEKGNEKISAAYSIEAETGIVDFEKYFGTMDYKTGYAYSYIYSPKSQQVHFYLGSDDCPKVWVNGELVHKLWMGGRGTKARDDYFKVDLDEGLNPVLIKVEDGWGEWKFILEVFSEEGHSALMSEEIKTWEQYWERNAKLSPDGFYPMWLSKKLAFWTVVGIDNDDKECLISENGTIEPYKRGYSIMPVMYVKDKIITRGNVRISQSLEKKYIPVPSVKWEHEDVTMTMTSFAQGEPGSSGAYVKYTVENNSGSAVSGKFYLLIRPFQVYPPWQGGGGFAPVTKIEYNEKHTVVNDKSKIYLLTEPDNFGVKIKKSRLRNKLEGDIIDNVNKGILPSEKYGSDTDGFLSAGIEYRFSLGKGEKKEIYIVIPMHGNVPEIVNKKSGIPEEFERLHSKTVSYWEEKADKVE